MGSILTTIKKLLGITADDDSFDIDIIIHINSAIMTLNQLGVGVSGFTVSSDAETWDSFLGETTFYEAVKSYIYFRVRLAFDSPTGSGVLDSMRRQVEELEWRLQVQAESMNTEG